MDSFFDYMEVPIEKEVKMVAYKLKGGIRAWWDRVQTTRQTWESANKFLGMDEEAYDKIVCPLIINKFHLNNIIIVNKELTLSLNILMSFRNLEPEMTWRRMSLKKF